MPKLHTVRMIPEKCLLKCFVKQWLANFFCKEPLGLSVVTTQFCYSTAEAATDTIHK